MEKSAEPPVATDPWIQQSAAQCQPGSPTSYEQSSGPSLLKIASVHGIAFVVISLTAIGASISSRMIDAATMAAVGVSFGYFTLLACWFTFGRTPLRFALVPALMLGLYVLQTVVFLLSGAPGFQIIPATAVGSLAFFGLMLFSSYLLKWVSKVRIQHRSHADDAHTERLRYGIGELLLATGVVALLIAIGKTASVSVDGGSMFRRVFTIFTLLGLFHFILYWPLFLATLSVHRRVLTICAAALAVAIAIPVEVAVFTKLIALAPPGAMQNIYPILLFDIPYVVAIVTHLAITYNFGHRLVMRKRETRNQPAPVDNSAQIFS